MDTWPGSVFEPSSLHKYLYCEGNPVNRWDPSGRMHLALQIAITVGVGLLITAILYATFGHLLSWLGGAKEPTTWKGWVNISSFGIFGTYGCFSAKFEGTHESIKPRHGIGFYLVFVFGISWGLPYNFSTAQNVTLESPGLWGANPGVLSGPVYWISTSFALNRNDYKGWASTIFSMGMGTSPGQPGRVKGIDIGQEAMGGWSFMTGYIMK